jgi:hypothetical protein
VPEHDGEANRSEKDQDQHIPELLEQQPPRGHGAGGLELVRAVLH